MRYERPSSITGLTWLLMWVLALLVPDIRSALATDEGIAGAPATEVPPQTPQGTSGTARSREQALYTRSLQLLKRQPRPGAALDRVLQFHEEHDSFPQFLAELVAAQTEPGDISAAAILGMTESFLGHDQQAREALQQATIQRPSDPVMPWLLGQICLKQNDAEAAVEHLQQALAMQPAVPDLLPISRELSLALRRAGRAEEISALWQAIEKQVGPNERVAEQIAGLVHSDGDVPEAIRRFEELSRTHSDPWKATQFGIKAAELKQQAGQTDAALQDFQALLSNLASESLQARRIRERIDAGFRQSGDLPGLVNWLQKRLDENPDDLDSLISLSALLTQTGRPQEAEHKLREALLKAPSSVRLLRALIRHLRDQGQPEAAVVIFESMEQQSLLQPDDLEDWAGLCLKLTSVSAEQQRRLATEVWKKQLQGHMDDPVLLRQTALHLRSTASPDEVIALYEAALRLDPDDVVTREQYGEYLLTLRRTDDALQVWRAIAEGRQQRPEQLRTLATILHRFGQTHEAITTFQQACTLDPDFEELLRLAQLMGDYQAGAARPFSEQSLQVLAQAESQCASEEDVERVLQLQVNVLQNSGQLTQRIDLLQRELFSPQSLNAVGIEPPTVERWLELATLCQAAERLAEAVQAAEQALKLAPESVRALRLMTRLYRASGRLADTVRLTQSLLRLDPQSRLVHLQTLAELELELGHLPEAANAAKKLAAMADNSIEMATFSSRLLMQAGQVPEALRILKRIAVANPEDPEVCLNYLKALVDARQRESAEEYCWQLLERRHDDDDLSLNVIPVLAELLQYSGRSSELPARLELLLASEEDSGRLTRCLSVAWIALGDPANARRALEQLLNSTEAQPEDSLRLAELCLTENDVKAAQQVLSRIDVEQLPETPRTQAEELLLRAVASGAQDLSVNAISTRWSREELLRRADQLLTDGSTPTALAILQQLSAQDSEEPRLLFRVAIGQWRQSSRPEALRLFRKLLEATSRPSALGSDIASQPTAASGVQDHAPKSTGIPGFQWWEQQFEKSNRILLATDQSAVLELQKCLEQPLSMIMVALLALSENAAQQDQLDTLFDEFQQAAEQRPTAAWDLWMLRRLRGSGHGEPWTNLADSLQLFHSGHPDGAAAVLADVIFLFGANPGESQNSVASATPRSARFVATPLTESDFTVILETCAAFAEQLSAEDLRRVSQAIVNACLAGPAELQQILATVTMKLRHSPENASDRLLSLRLAADFAWTTKQPPPSLIEILSALSTDQASPARTAAGQAQWEESSVGLVADVLAAAPPVLTPEAVTETLNWWVRLRAKESPQWRIAQDATQLPLSLLSTSSIRLQRHADGLGTQFLTSADRRLLERLATAVRQWNDRTADWSKRWKAGLAGRPSGENVPAVLAWMLVSDPRMHPETHTEGLNLLTQWIPEDPALLIRQMASDESAGDYTKAIEWLDQLPDNDPQLLRARELKAMQLATLSGSQSRTDLAATRLQGLQLSAAEQTEFLRLLRLAGLTELYSSEVQRLFPAASALSPERQMEQLNLLIARGQHQEAVQLAEELMRSTVANSGTRFRRTGRITADDVRRRAEEICRQFSQETGSPQAPPPSIP